LLGHLARRINHQQSTTTIVADGNEVAVKARVGADPQADRRNRLT